MSRLIDADANREKFKKIVYQTLNDCNITTNKKFNIIMTAFDNIPTAYDISKVVAELEKKRIEVQKMKNNCIALSDMEVCDVENITYDRAIDIVKRGGIDG